jgi:CSLREA domain-containing protein
MAARGAICACVLALAASPAGAATITVNDLGDAPGTCPGTPCTLRAALAAAIDGDTIEFDPAFAYPASVSLNGTELAIGVDVTVLGPGSDRLTLSGGTQSRVLSVAASSVRIEGLGLANGRRQTAGAPSGPPGTGQPGSPALTAEGGCIRVAAGATLVLERVALVSCSAIGGAAGHGDNGTSGAVGGPGGNGGDGGTALGGAIANFGTLSLIDSSIQGALAIGGAGGDGGDGGSGVTQGMGGSGGAGGAARGAAIYVAPGAALLLRNSTLTASSASGGAGGEGGVSNGLSGVGGNGGTVEGGQLYLGTALTLADLEFASLGPASMQPGPPGPGGGGAVSGAMGLARGEVLFAGSVPRVRNSVLVGEDAAIDCQGSVNGSGANMDSDSSCGGFTLHGSYATHFVTPGVQELAGRAVLQPLPGALPIDAAEACLDLDGALVTQDQNARLRPIDGDGNGVAACDAGAYEFSPQIFANGFED